MTTSNHRPNILIITTDQQRTDSLSLYGPSPNHTPHLDRLGASGVVFNRAYCTNPVCTPSRASLFSGFYLSRHGAWNVGTLTDDRLPMVSHRLSQAGYRTHYVGKAHFQAFDGRPSESMEPTRGWESLYPAFQGPYYGFETVELAFGHVTYGITGHYGAWVRSQVTEEEFRGYHSARDLSQSGKNFGGNAYDWDLPTALHNSVWTADRTIAFLEQHSGDQPFLLAVGFQDPHHPHALPLDYPNRADPAAVPLPDYQEGELEDKPPHFLAARHGHLEQAPSRGEYMMAGQGSGADYTQVTEADARLGRAYYYSMVRLIDDQVGRILNCLDELGLAENTLVIFTTDHGELLGDHGLWMKGPFHYEQLVRVPMLLRWPAAVPAGQRFDQLMSHVDIVPTLLAAAGADIPPELDGVNLLPHLSQAETAGSGRPANEAVFIECVDDPHRLRLKTVVTQDMKMTVYHGQDYGELYDLTRDPSERANLWNDPAYAGTRARLYRLLLDHTEPLEKRSPRIGYA